MEQPLPGVSKAHLPQTPALPCRTVQSGLNPPADSPDEPFFEIARGYLRKTEYS